MFWTKETWRYMKALPFLPLLSRGHVGEARVIKQIGSCFIQIEGCKKQLFQILRKTAEEIGIHQGELLGLGFSSHGKEVFSSFLGKCLKGGERRIEWDSPRSKLYQVSDLPMKGQFLYIYIFFFFWCIFIVGKILNACQGPLTHH